MQYAKPVTLNVEECDRLSFLPYLFGLDFLYAEASVYALAKKMMPSAGLTHLYRMRDAQLWSHIEFHPECNAIYAALD